MTTIEQNMAHIAALHARQDCLLSLDRTRAKQNTQAEHRALRRLQAATWKLMQIERMLRNGL